MDAERGQEDVRNPGPPAGGWCHRNRWRQMPGTLSSGNCAEIMAR